MLNHRNRNVQQLAVRSDKKIYIMRSSCGELNERHLRKIQWSCEDLWAVFQNKSCVYSSYIQFGLTHTHKMHFILLCLGLSSQSFKQGPVSLLLTNFELPFQKPKILLKLKWQFSLSFSLVFSKMTHLLFVSCVFITVCSHSFYQFFLRIRTRVRP